MYIILYTLNLMNLNYLYCICLWFLCQKNYVCCHVLINLSFIIENNMHHRMSSTPSWLIMFLEFLTFISNKNYYQSIRSFAFFTVKTNKSWRWETLFHSESILVMSADFQSRFKSEKAEKYVTIYYIKWNIRIWKSK